MKQNVLHAWKLETIRFFVRLAAAAEEADTAQRQDMQTMRPILTKITALKTQAALNADTRVELLDTLDEADTMLTRIMGQHWQPHGAFATTLRSKGGDVAKLLG